MNCMIFKKQLMRNSRILPANTLYALLSGCDCSDTSKAAMNMHSGCNDIITIAISVMSFSHIRAIKGNTPTARNITQELRSTKSNSLNGVVTINYVAMTHPFLENSVFLRHFWGWIRVLKHEDKSRK